MTKTKKVLVLGGGFAGLSAAIHVALQGHEVTLLEQLGHLGGKASEVREHGYRFDTGPSVFTLPEVFEDIFVQANQPCPLEYEAVDPLCRYFYPDGFVWDVSKDDEFTTSQLDAADAKAYVALKEEAKTLYEGAANTFLFQQAPSLMQLMRYGLTSGLSAHPTKSLIQLLKHFGASEKLQQFFLRFATYFGANPYKAPAVLHNIAWVELGLGVYYPKGGIYELVKALKGLAESLGVTIQTRCEVEKLVHVNGVVKTVETTQGSYQADFVVSTLDIVRTQQLLGREGWGRRLEPSLSGLVLLLGLKEPQQDLAHHNITFSKDYKAEFAAIEQGKLSHDPTVYLSSSSKANALDAPLGAENCFLMVNAPPVRISGQRFSREDYMRYSEVVLSELKKRGFNLVDVIESKHFVPPTHLELLASYGSIYGTAPHSLLSTIRPKQTLKGVSNLLLAGGSVHPGGGIPLSLLSGKHAANLLAQKTV